MGNFWNTGNPPSVIKFARHQPYPASLTPLGSIDRQSTTLSAQLQTQRQILAKYSAALSSSGLLVFLVRVWATYFHFLLLIITVHALKFCRPLKLFITEDGRPGLYAQFRAFTLHVFVYRSLFDHPESRSTYYLVWT